MIRQLTLAAAIVVAAPALAQSATLRAEADRLRADAAGICAREPDGLRCSQARNLAVAAQDRYDGDRGVERAEDGYADARGDRDRAAPRDDDEVGYADPGIMRARPLVYRDPVIRSWAVRFFDRDGDRTLDPEEARRAAEALLLMADFDNDRRLSISEARFARERADWRWRG